MARQGSYGKQSVAYILNQDNGDNPSHQPLHGWDINKPIETDTKPRGLDIETHARTGDGNSKGMQVCGSRRTAAPKAEITAALKPERNESIRSIVETQTGTEVTAGVTPQDGRRSKSSVAHCSGLKKHKRLSHRHQKPFACTFCGRRFAEKSNMKKHCHALHEDNAARWPCPICKKAFKFSDGLRRHISDCHLGLRPFQCQDPGCSKAFKQRSHLKKHHDRIHANRGTREPVCKA